MAEEPNCWLLVVINYWCTGHELVLRCLMPGKTFVIDLISSTLDFQGKKQMVAKPSSLIVTDKQMVDVL